MALSIRDENTGEIKTWVWAVAGLVVFGVVFVVFRGSGGSASSGGSTVGQSSDLTSLLQSIQQEILDLQKGTGNVPKEPRQPRKNPTNPAPGSILLRITKGLKFWNKTSGGPSGSFQSSQTIVGKLITIGKRKFYLIESGPHTGQYIPYWLIHPKNRGGHTPPDRDPPPGNGHNKKPKLNIPKDYHPGRQTFR